MNSATTISSDIPDPWHELPITARWCRRVVLGGLSQVKEGRLTIVEGPDRCVFGHRTEGFDVDVTVTIQTPQFYRAVALGGSVAIGEAYADGLWTCDDLPGLIRLFTRTQKTLYAADGALDSDL